MVAEVAVGSRSIISEDFFGLLDYHPAVSLKVAA
jgi:hypothetical protein